MHGRRTDRRPGDRGAERAGAHQVRGAEEGAHGKGQVAPQRPRQGLVAKKEEAVAAQAPLAYEEALPQPPAPLQEPKEEIEEPSQVAQEVKESAPLQVSEEISHPAEVSLAGTQAQVFIVVQL